MNNTFIGTIVGIGEEYRPIRWQRSGVDCKAMVLSGDETSLRVSVDAGLVVTTVTVSRENRVSCEEAGRQTDR